MSYEHDNGNKTLLRFIVYEATFDAIRPIFDALFSKRHLEVLTSKLQYSMASLCCKQFEIIFITFPLCILFRKGCYIMSFLLQEQKLTII